MMKNVIYSMAVLFNSAMLVLLIGCSKENSTNDYSNAQLEQKAASCTVKCSKGKCSASGTGASCTCSAAGMPDCRTSGGVGAGANSISVDAEQLLSLQDLQQYLLSLENSVSEAGDAAGIVNDMINLFESNNYLLIDQVNVEEYYMLLDQFIQLHQYFTLDQLEEMSNI